MYLDYGDAEPIQAGYPWTPPLWSIVPHNTKPSHSLTHSRSRAFALSLWRPRTRGLDLARGERALLVRAHKLAGLVGDLAEDARDELR